MSFINTDFNFCYTDPGFSPKCSSISRILPGPLIRSKNITSVIIKIPSTIKIKLYESSFVKSSELITALQMVVPNGIPRIER